MMTCGARQPVTGGVGMAAAPQAVLPRKLTLPAIRDSRPSSVGRAAGSYRLWEQSSGDQPMGAWGTGIFANDTAADVRAQFREKLDDGMSPTAARKALLQHLKP